MTKASPNKITVKHSKKLRALPNRPTASLDGPEDVSRLLDAALVEAVAADGDFDEEPETDISRVLSAVVDDFEDAKPKKKPKSSKKA